MRLHGTHPVDHPGVGSRDGTELLETARSRVDGSGVERPWSAVTDGGVAGAETPVDD